MKSEDFDLVSTLVKDRSGLVLTKEKVYLLESRLMPLARRRKLDTSTPSYQRSGPERKRR